MTVTVNQDIETFNGNDVTTAFPFTVISQNVTDIKAYHMSVALVETRLVQDTDFTVVLNADGTSTITFPAVGSTYSTLATGEVLTVRRVVNLTQLLSLSQHGAYNPKAVENALDKLTQAIQQIYPDSPSAGGNIIYFDADGYPQKGLDYNSLVSVSAFSQFYLDPVAYDALETYTLQQTTVIQGGVVYAPHPDYLPIGPEAFDGSHWMVVQGYVSGTGDLLDLAGGNIDDVGMLNLGEDEAVTISVGEITPTKSFHKIANEGGAATDDLDTINGGADGDILVLMPSSSGQDITFKDGTGNLNLSGDFTTGDTSDSITLIYRNTGTPKWYELSRTSASVNGSLHQEGTFVPAITFGGAAVGITYSKQVGFYTKIGNRVHFNLYIVLTSKGSSTGDIRITNLPFSSASISDNYAAVSVFALTLTSIVGHLQGYVNHNGEDKILIHQLGTGTHTALNNGNIQNTSAFMISGTYKAAT